MVPEVAGLSVEEINVLFEGPWLNAFKRSKHLAVIESAGGSESGNFDKRM
jgi:hypothetical protein